MYLPVGDVAFLGLFIVGEVAQVYQERIYIVLTPQAGHSVVVHIDAHRNLFPGEHRDDVVPDPGEIHPDFLRDDLVRGRPAPVGAEFPRRDRLHHCLRVVDLEVPEPVAVVPAPAQLIVAPVFPAQPRDLAGGEADELGEFPRVQHVVRAEGVQLGLNLVLHDRKDAREVGEGDGGLYVRVLEQGVQEGKVDIQVLLADLLADKDIILVYDYDERLPFL